MIRWWRAGIGFVMLTISACSINSAEGDIGSSGASPPTVAMPAVTTTATTGATTPESDTSAPGQRPNQRSRTAAEAAATSGSATRTPRAAHSLQTVFVIMMENHNWASIKRSPSAPYINATLLPRASHAEQYYNPAGVHPSLPNYLWLEAGTAFGIRDDGNPGAHHQRTTSHLVTLLEHAGITWKSYQEDIDRATCPLAPIRKYAPKHDPMVYFDDVTATNKPNAASCVAHVRPYTELARDLQRNTVARYNFITPNLCDDMHDTFGCATYDSIRNGDTWLAHAVPQILASQPYRAGGVLFITWDEGEGSDGPIGMIVLSPHAKGAGYTNTIRYTHSSTLRTVQEIFGVTPWLGDGANAPDLRDLFTSFP